MRTKLILSTALLSLVIGACGPDFPPEEIVEKDRPLAGRVSVIGDETRASPAPGDTARYDFLVGSPGAQVAWNYVFVVCGAVTTPVGLSVCDTDFPFVAITPIDAPSITPPDEMPSVTFTVPSAQALGDRKTLLVQGFLCPNSALDPALLSTLSGADPQSILATPNPCADKTQNGLIVATPIRLQITTDDTNHTPLVADVAWSNPPSASPVVFGTAWTTAAVAGDTATGCAGKGFPEIPTSPDRLGLQVRLAPGAREVYSKPSPIEGEPARVTTETPLVEALASAGDFKILRDNQQSDDQVLQLTWRAPTENVASDGTLVRFWFLVSDDRDGSARATSWTERALCVLPAN